LVFLKKVMSKNTSILLGDRYEKFIAKEVSNGKYNSASKVIRASAVRDVSAAHPELGIMQIFNLPACLRQTS
jgi:putative lipoic acid-binding regulatory protein